MIWHVYHRSLKAQTIDEVWVATDDKRIYDEVKGWEGNVMMTRADHASGTDRVSEVAEKVPCDIVVNVQGDEPMIDPGVIDAVVKPLEKNASLGIVTPVVRVKSLDEFLDPSVAKVVLDAEGFALYFSRAPIPFSREHKGFLDVGLKSGEDSWEELPEGQPFFRHVGIYGYHRETLHRFCGLPASHLEDVEKLEQLRALEYGIPIYTVEVDYRGIGVDTPQDLERVERRMASDPEMS